MESEQHHRDKEMLELQKNIFCPKEANSTYKNRYKTYKKWASSRVGLKPDEEGRFITRYNIDKFFMEHLRPKKDILTSTISQYADAL